MYIGMKLLNTQYINLVYFCIFDFYTSYVMDGLLL